MQLTPAGTTYSILANESVSCDYDRFYGHVSERERLFGIFEYGALA